MADLPDETAEVVRRKEETIKELQADAGALGRWRRLADVWCSGWFWGVGDRPVPTAGEFADLSAAVRGVHVSLPAARVAARLAEVRQVAKTIRFFHWTLEFPEVFYDERGGPLARPGFDAVVTNPPWEMVRADTGSAEERAATHAGKGSLVRFVRESGTYAACRDGHANLYQLFLERCLRLTRPGGRLGLILPWGLACDHGCAALRRHLFERCQTDVLVGFENAAGLFPIHRAVRFLLVSSSPGTPTREVRCHFGHRDPAVLEHLSGSPPAGFPEGAPGVSVTPEFLVRASGQAMALPYVRTPGELALLARLTCAHPSLESPEGWHARFGRELNATDDRGLMTKGGRGMPVVEGKHIGPFRVRTGAATLRIRSEAGLSPELRRAAASWRVVYRDVASSTNALTLIAAMLPPGHVTVHTVFCLKTRLPRQDMACLVALLNSFVANYLVRLWVTTHVSAATIARVPVPRPRAGSGPFTELAGLARALGRDTPAWHGLHVRAQVAAAKAYGVTPDEFATILASFPLVEAATRDACLDLLRCPPCLPV